MASTQLDARSPPLPRQAEPDRRRIDGDAAGPVAPAIVADGLTKTFRARPPATARGLGRVRALFRPAPAVEVPAVRGISFRVQPGERVAFIGPNGAGKSTTLKMLTGILYPTSGHAEVAGGERLELGLP